MRNTITILIGCIMAWGCGTSTPNAPNDNFLLDLMEKNDFFRPYLQNKDSLEIQIIYTQIDRDSANRPSFNTHHFNVDATRYFYPASTVKLPLVLLTLEKLNELGIEGLDRNTPMFHDSVYVGQRSVIHDLQSANGLPSVSNYAKKILIASDNDAYNRLYEFLGQRHIYTSMHERGYTLRVLHRFDRALSGEENRHTEAVRFVQGDSLMYRQDGLYNAQPIVPPRKVLKGKGYVSKGSLISKPLDFTYKNCFPLEDQHRLLKALVFPSLVEEEARFNLTENDRQFVLKYMSQLPGETLFPPYALDTAYYDAYCKFLIYGEGREPISPQIRIFNKIGLAYGYVIDNAYIVDFNHGVEFMLSAVIHANPNGIYNDNTYAYGSLGLPFMKELGEMVYRYELKRRRKHTPDLSDFVFTYDNQAK